MTEFHHIRRPAAALVPLFLLMTALIFASAVSADYQLVDLGANVAPRDVNNSGQVAGARNTDQYPTIAFRWIPGIGFEDLDGTSAYAINDSGIVAGSTLTGAFILDGNTRSWDKQGAYGVNEFGQVSGNKAGVNPYRTTSIPYNPAVYNGSKWVVMDIAEVYPRGTRQGVYADQYILFDINDGGYAVGRKSRYGLAGSSAILIAPPYSGIKSISDVEFLPTPYGGSANAINEGNLIVGTTGNGSSGNYAFAFLYDGVTVHNLGTLGGLRSGASDINDFDQVVGYSETSAGNRAFVWDLTNGMQDLNGLAVDAGGWVLESAIAINNAGEIVGTGQLNGQPHGFLLTSGQPPTPTNQAPVAIIVADVTSGKGPLEVQFTGDQSSDPDGTIATYAWDFGDGETSSEANPIHTYVESGNYICTLIVTDNAGKIDTAQVDITVRKGKGKRG